MGCTPKTEGRLGMGVLQTTSKIIIGGMGKWPKIKIWNLLLQMQ